MKWTYKELYQVFQHFTPDVATKTIALSVINHFETMGLPLVCVELFAPYTQEIEYIMIEFQSYGVTISKTECMLENVDYLHEIELTIDTDLTEALESLKRKIKK